MHTVTTKELIENIRPFHMEIEGDVPHFYLDSGGAPTIGRGHLVLPPLTNANPNDYTNYIIHPITHKQATLPEIEADLDAVMRMLPDKSPGYYNPGNIRLIMISTEIDVLWQRDIKEKLSIIKHHFPLFSQYPLEAQMAILDMAFNHGPGYIICHVHGQKPSYL